MRKSLSGLGQDRPRSTRVGIIVNGGWTCFGPSCDSTYTHDESSKDGIAFFNPSCFPDKRSKS